jgi:hypothetical protein
MNSKWAEPVAGAQAFFPPGVTTLQDSDRKKSEIYPLARPNSLPFANPFFENPTGMVYGSGKQHLYPVQRARRFSP